MGILITSKERQKAFVCIWINQKWSILTSFHSNKIIYILASIQFESLIILLFFSIHVRQDE